MWNEAIDPCVLRADAIAAEPGNQNAIDLLHLKRLRTTVARSAITEHVAIDDGLRRLRLDILHGTVLAGPVRLRFLIEGPDGAEPRVLALRRLLGIARHGRLLASLNPKDPRMARYLAALRVHDALADGASHREIAIALYGHECVAASWGGRSDALQSRIRRAAGLARRLAAGGYRKLLQI